VWVVVALVTFATFTDILAYSIAVPVLPDISRRFGASPTLVGLLFASFGLTVLATSVPMGAISDRTGRRLPLVGGMLLLAVSAVAFAYAPSLPWLFAARLLQGAADAITWVVGFAVIADVTTSADRGRAMGFAMSGSTFGFMTGPTFGGWLYEAGGPTLPYLLVAGLALVSAIGLALVRLPPPAGDDQGQPDINTIARTRSVIVCAIAVTVGGGTIAMTEPILSLFLSSALGLGPARIGLVFGAGGVISAVMHPVFGRVADRTGARRLTLLGLGCVGATLPLLTQIDSFGGAVLMQSLFALAIAVLVTPSLAYMAEGTAATGAPSFGVAYGIYNFAWALGLLTGPSIGGYVYERTGFGAMLSVWAMVVVAVAVVLWPFSTNVHSPAQRGQTPI
jgi:MFS transporter, DHA1 family, solute carrier family 18 (vesicular amine transporter), member 1/2